MIHEQIGLILDHRYGTPESHRASLINQFCIIANALADGLADKNEVLAFGFRVSSVAPD